MFAMREPAEGRTGVLFVNAPTLPPLGADTWVHVQIIHHLDRTRFAPVVGCAVGRPDEPSPYFAALRDGADIEIVPIDLGPELSTSASRGRVRTILATLPALTSFVRLARLVRSRGIEIIHTSDRPRDAAFCVLLARVTRTRCIVHVHVGYGEWMSRILKWALRRADALVAISAFVAETLVESGHDPSRMHVVLNSIDTDRWVPGNGRAEIRTELGIGPDEPVVLAVCRLFEAKGVRELIQAVPAMRDERPDVRVLVVGREMQQGLRQELEELADALGVGDSVTFVGQRSDVPRFMAAADIYAMPSQWEPFGLVFAEAMAMKLPVVALDNGGTPEVVVHGVTGLLSPLGNAEALTVNLRALLKDPARRTDMGERGRVRVLEHFGLARMARDVERVYDDITGQSLTERGIDGHGEAAHV